MRFGISIHALLAESDGNGGADTGVAARFLSTLSLRRATATVGLNLVGQIFLSTLSLRRATVHEPGRLAGILISIHALLAESDSVKSFMRNGFFLISIHALLAESDSSPNTDIIILDISIHALLAESDAPDKNDRGTGG